MKVDVVNLGSGLFRLDTTPTVCGEFFPSHVMDKVMKDVIMKEREKRNFESRCTCMNDVINTPTKPWFERGLEPKRRSYAELDALKRWGEPDGIDVHVDRPLRENFPSQKDWALAMAKYRTLEDVAKDCDWECREPMKGTDFYHSNLDNHCCPKASWCVEDEGEWFNDFDDEEEDSDWCEWFFPQW